MVNRKSNDMMCFYANNKTTVYIPRGIERFFNNLIGIFIVQGRLQYIEQDDFKPFTNLTNIDFFGNKIEILEDDLFMYNPKLKSISFDQNPIIHVGMNVFDILSSLRSLVFYNCKCGSGGAVNSTSTVNNLVSNIKIKCNQTVFSQVSKAIKDLEYDLQNLNPTNISTFIKKLDNLEIDLKPEII